MKTHSGSTSEGFLPPITAGNSGGGTAVAPAPEDPKATFADFLQQQQQGSGATVPRSATLFDSALANATPNAATTTTTGTTPAIPTVPWAPVTPAVPTTPPSTTWPQAGKTATPAAPPAPPAPTATVPPTVTSTLDASALATPTLKTKGTSLHGKQDAPPSSQDETPTTDEDSSPTSSKTLLAGPDLSVMLARAAMLAANARATATTSAANTTSTAAATTSDASEAADDASDDLPVLAWGMKSSATPTAEKKSAALTAGRSFIQPDTSSASTLGMALILGSASGQANLQSTANQSLATSKITAGIGSAGVSSDALASAGMASGKKEHEMNATLDLTDLMASTGTTPAATRPSADVNILLSTNNDFKDALSQVMHVAELSNLSTTTPPLRVAIEIQTPPGAVVNLYVSKQQDNTYRAQLSTDDVQALSWVQDQIGALKQTSDTGVEVRWLPAQLESAAPTFSSSSETGLGWNRGGQGQGWQSSQQQQADDRQQSQRQKRNGYGDFLNPDLSMPFVGALGRAA